MKPVILIVENDENQRVGLKKALETSGYRIMLAANADEALGLMGEGNVDVILTDLRMPGGSGMALMKKARGVQPDVTTILFTAYGTVETAVEAMKQGAYDFLTKPINIDRLEMVVRRALSTRAIERENIDLRRRLDDRYSVSNIIGGSEEMQEVLTAVRQIAPTKATVLIGGERGTGKELIARAIHGLSNRSRNSFIAVHCAALSRDLLESELFGHERGAFTGAVKRRAGRFEMADGGTLFLDEISEMDLATQVKLLRVLQEQEFERVGGSATVSVDVRVIAATNADLESLMGKGKFREDLYDRLNVVRLTAPPLRDRKSDIPLLLSSFIKEFGNDNNKLVSGVTPETMDALVAYDWPGNVRELRNCVERIVILTSHPVIGLSELPLNIRESAIKPLPGGAEDTRPRPRAEVVTIKGAERRMIEDALEKTGGNRTEAALLLGISRRTLHRKINSYGIKVPRR